MAGRSFSHKPAPISQGLLDLVDDQFNKHARFFFLRVSTPYRLRLAVYLWHSNSGEAVSTYLFEPTRESCKIRRMCSLTKVSRASALDQLSLLAEREWTCRTFTQLGRRSPLDHEFKCRNSSCVCGMSLRETSHHAASLPSPTLESCRYEVRSEPTRAIFHERGFPLP